MSKVLILGIDGLDPILLKNWKNDLPNIGKLLNNDSEISIDSTFPPDSICAWGSIYTGENPAEHGLIESIDYLAGKKSHINKNRGSYFQGKTFWDIAGKKGNKVCIINPFLAYPAWDVNGIMISGPVFEGGEISVFPSDFLSEYNFPPLGGMVDFPDEKDLERFIHDARELTKQIADVSLQIYKDQNIDLFFLTFLTLDRIKHFIWRFTDEDDNYFPGENSFKNAIKDFYLLFDSIIGQFLDALKKDTTLIVISDHGHRRRCTKCLNLNEILRKNGTISINSSGAKGKLRILTERAKVMTIAALSKYGLQDWIYKIAKFVPNRKALKKSTYLINKESSAVSLSNLCGTNPYGGIDIKGDTVEEYEILRDKTINELMDLNKTIGETVVKWVKKREEIYRGQYEDRLPDILFELEDDYGVGMDFFTSDITPNYSYKKISGGHKREAVLLTGNTNGKIKSIKRPDTVEDVNRYILKILKN